MTSPIKGYSPVDQIKADLVNRNKNLEEKTLRILDELEAREEVDKRWLEIGRTHIEQAFMAINRSILKPERLRDPL